MQVHVLRQARVTEAVRRSAPGIDAPAPTKQNELLDSSTPRVGHRRDRNAGPAVSRHHDVNSQRAGIAVNTAVSRNHDANSSG